MICFSAAYIFSVLFRLKVRIVGKRQILEVKNSLCFAAAPAMWEALAAAELDAALKVQPITSRAKNVLFFLGYAEFYRTKPTFA